MSLDIAFQSRYADLPAQTHTRMPPTPVAAPGLIAVNDALARELGLDPEGLRTPEGVQMLAGNMVPEGARPLAQAYAGHQFGGWSPQLGDGRALLLGEVTDTRGRLRDVQLKGSGPTPYSRRGDGRSALGPVLREYVVSEAMHALGIPTTRALAAVTTGERVQRERAMPGGVLTRVAASHIRVGTFQYFAARNDGEALRALTDHVIARHYPDAASPLDLLRAVMERQADLVVRWMGVGFIHGVMNTDNMAVSGETIDYGPCAFMEAYSPHQVFSSIDQFGRYAYDKQPDMALWNLAQLASALLPLMGGAGQEAVDEAGAVLHDFAPMVNTRWIALFRSKIGLATAEDGDSALISTLLDRMARTGADFTNVFRGLATGTAREHFPEPEAYDAWEGDWQARLAREPEDTSARMAQVNPAVIPRNHRVEEVIQAGIAGDFAPFERLNAVLATPFELRPEDAAYTSPARPDERVTRTFCGT